MTTTTEIATAAPILAIDLGKYKSVACVYRSAEDLRFLSMSTTREELARLLERQRPAVVLIEACLLAGWVHLARPADRTETDVAPVEAATRGLIAAPWTPASLSLLPQEEKT